MNASLPNEGGWDDRTRLLLGDEQTSRLNQAHVMIAGLGGVGSAVAEMLCRAGVGELSLIDGDRVHPSNRNRQLIALSSTEGQMKTGVLAARLAEIHPGVKVHVFPVFISDENVHGLLTARPDYVVDAIDMLSPKAALIAAAMDLKIPVISSLGSGGKTDPGQVQVADLSASNHCRLGYYLRKKLHKMGIYRGCKVVFSPEPVSRSAIRYIHEKYKKTTTGTVSYMPVVFACHLTAEVVRELGKPGSA